MEGQIYEFQYQLKMFFCMIYAGKYDSNKFLSQWISVQSTKTGIHENKAIHSIFH